MHGNPSVWHVHVNVQRVRQFAHCTFHPHIGHWSQCPIIEHIRQSDHCTYTCTRQVLVNVQWPVCLTCACKCEDSQKIRSLHIFMHTSVTGLTAQLHDSRISARLHAHIRCMWTCSDSCVWRVHLNVQWVRQLTNCTFSCTPRSLCSLPNYMNTSYSRITARLHAHIRCM